jgi:hypothetical protein
VDAVLFVEHWRNTIILENPSMPPWITRCHLETKLVSGQLPQGLFK